MKIIAFFILLITLSPLQEQYLNADSKHSLTELLFCQELSWKYQGHETFQDKQSV